MLFNSPEYLLFLLPLAFLGYQLLSRHGNTERQILWLALMSLVFYASWKPAYLLLIGASIGANFLFGRHLGNCQPDNKKRWLILGICFNLLLLGYFKYTNFFLEGLNSLGDWLIPIPEITLPLAISFFTFQQIAYLVDVARGECKEYQFHHYALFVLFFPQLIAGPIVHHSEMMPQFERSPQGGRIHQNVAVGLTFIALGLLKKVGFADSLALIVDPVFDSAAQGVVPSRQDALLGSLAFSFQIYFDFSGYSDIAIGSARLFGIRLPENFRSPYKSSSIIEIWRRWHMTLSRFLRDYLYISLGGNRHGRSRRYLNLIITMLLGGLWHGAAWTFVLWGGLHGMYLCINHGWRALTRRTGLEPVARHRALTPVYILITFLCWTVAMVFFRAADAGTALQILDAAVQHSDAAQAELLGAAMQQGFFAKVFTLAGWTHSSYYEAYLLLAACAVTCWLLPNSQQFLADYDPVISREPIEPPPHGLRWKPGLGYALLTAFVLGCSLLSLSTASRFIYFQF